MPCPTFYISFNIPMDVQCNVYNKNMPQTFCLNQWNYLCTENHLHHFTQISLVLFCCEAFPLRLLSTVYPNVLNCVILLLSLSFNNRDFLQSQYIQLMTIFKAYKMSLTSKVSVYSGDTSVRHPAYFTAVGTFCVMKKSIISRWMFWQDYCVEPP